MKTKRPLKHLPKPLRKLYKLFKTYHDLGIKYCLIEEMKRSGFNEFAFELELNEKQNSLRNGI